MVSLVLGGVSGLKTKYQSEMPCITLALVGRVNLFRGSGQEPEASFHHVGGKWPTDDLLAQR